MREIAPRVLCSVVLTSFGSQRRCGMNWDQAQALADEDAAWTDNRAASTLPLDAAVAAVAGPGCGRNDPQCVRISGRPRRAAWCSMPA